MNRTMKLFCVMFLSMGILFAGIGVGFHVYETKCTERMIPVSGAIVDFVLRKPIIAYTVDGQEYTMRSSTSSSSMRVGDSYSLLVDPDDPARAVDVTAFGILKIVFGALGVVMIAVGDIVTVVTKRGKKKRELLLSTGMRVSATVREARVNHAITVNGAHPINLLAECRDPVTGAEITVKSHALWNSAYAPGDKVDVVFDPMDPAKYAFDIPEDRA